VHSAHGAVAHIQGTITKVLSNGANTGDGEHQHILVKVAATLPLKGNVGSPSDPSFQPDLVGHTLFLALRFGDSDANHGPIPFKEGTPIEVQGEYISPDRARPTTGNDGKSGPILGVVHFTHAPLGFIVYEGKTTN
jgi:hypothetical protein